MKIICDVLDLTDALAKVTRALPSKVMIGVNNDGIKMSAYGDKVTLTANEMALKQFAKNFAPDVVVLEPQTLRDQVREELERGAAAYRL